MPTTQDKINALRIQVGEEVLAISDNLGALETIIIGLTLIVALGTMVAACLTGVGCVPAILGLVIVVLGLIKYIADDDEVRALEAKQAELEKLTGQMAAG